MFDAETVELNQLSQLPEIPGKADFQERFEQAPGLAEDMLDAANTAPTGADQSACLRLLGARLLLTAFDSPRTSSITVAGFDRIDVSYSGVGFNDMTPIAKPAFTDSSDRNEALAALHTKLASYGLISDGTSA